MEKAITTLKDLGELRAEEIMTSPVVTVNIGDSIHDVAKLFAEKNISGAAVLNSRGVPVGAITKSDLARYDAERLTLVTTVADKKSSRARRTAEDMERPGFHLEPEEATLELWMTPVIFEVHPKTILAAVAKKMVKNGLHHILVTEGNNKDLKGIITTFDLLLVLARVLNPA